SDLVATSNYRSGRSGVTHVNLNQRYQGREVFGGHVTVNVSSAGAVLLANGSLVRGLAAASPGEPALGALQAVEAAAEALGLAPPAGLTVLSSEGGPARKTTCSQGGVSRAPIPARLGWQPTSGGLRLAWQLVIDDSSAPHLWNATVDAGTGQLLDLVDWTQRDPLAELTSTLGSSLASNSASIAPPHPVIDGSSYRVLVVPTESPNDRPRALISNPADGDASPFGWHDTDGAVGPEFTITRGNNAHAYLDQDANNSPDFGFDVDGGSSLTFDFPADLAEHSQAYRPAVTTNLFYGCNVIHDLTWRYGFDEASGNFQANNYGRGGVGGDAVRCEAADGAGTNNANFSTPAMDGGAPRMQMFLWPGNQFGPQNEVVVDGLGSFGSSWARFSPPPTVAGTAGAIINAGNGCTAADYAGAPAGDWMAVVTGSNAGCQNVEKARQAGAAGARALIVALNGPGTAPILSGSLSTAAPTIPVASITQADGDAIRAAIA
ncbi:MAG TPA: M36 family metallopeptidase, partial [Vicinamibacteria bacterium]|nr:M36 family metallopeptidase [Vicinamibacteria bacterium]